MISPAEYQRLMELAERVSDKAKALGRAEEDAYSCDVDFAEDAHDEAWLDLRDALEKLTDRSP